MANSKWDNVAGSDKALIMVIVILAMTAIIIVLSCLFYYHSKPEALLIEEEKTARLDMIFDYLRFKDETALKLYLTHIKDMATAAGSDLTENEVKEIQDKIKHGGIQVEPE
jgi:hypothetical protein